MIYLLVFCSFTYLLIILLIVRSKERKKNCIRSFFRRKVGGKWGGGGERIITGGESHSHETKTSVIPLTNHNITNNAVKQALEGNNSTGKWHSKTHARKSQLVLHWLIKWSEYLNQSHSTVEQNQRKQKNLV